jgi:hypothetical protein
MRTQEYYLQKVSFLLQSIERCVVHCMFLLKDYTGNQSRQAHISNLLIDLVHFSSQAQNREAVAIPVPAYPGSRSRGVIVP